MDSSPTPILNSVRLSLSQFVRLNPGYVRVAQSWMSRRPIALFSVAGFITELILLSRCPIGIFRSDWVAILFAISYVLLFWCAVGVAVLAAVSVVRKAYQHSRSLGRACLCGISLLSLLAASGYVVSWGYFLKSGRFLDLETVNFCVHNGPLLWDYISAAEPIHLAVGGALLLCCGALLPLVFVHLSQRHSSCRRSQLQLLLVISVVAFVTRVCWNSMPVLPSSLLQAQRIHAIRFAIHPTFSLVINKVYQAWEGTVAKNLDVRQLRKRKNDANQAAPPQRPSIIIVAVESLRADAIHQHHLSVEVLPNINRLAQAGIHFRRAYAQSTHSDYADVCVVSSLYPLRTRLHHYYSPTDPWPKTLIHDILKPWGYSTAIISSQNECWGGMSHFLASENLDLFYHPETHHGPSMQVTDRDNGFANEMKYGALVAGKFPDQHTTDVAIAWIRRQVCAGKPFFLCMNFQSSHFPYLLPQGTPEPFQPCELGPTVSFVDYPPEETPNVRNAYFNAIHECDRQVGRLVSALQSLRQLDGTILVVTGENGEAFHECGTVTHAREPVEPAVHVALVVHAPHLIPPAEEDYPVEHVDIAPTVLGVIGIPPHPNFQGIDVLSQRRPALDRRLTFTHVCSGLANADAVTLAGRWKLTRMTDTGLETLHDLQTDPQQSVDISTRHSGLRNRLSKILREWRQRQLAYHQYPEYYLSYYPPSPPVWNDSVDERTLEVRASDGESADIE